MSGPELTPVVSATVALNPWFVWEPLTPANVTLVALAICGLWMMHSASRHRNRQIDAQTETLKSMSVTLTAQTEALRSQTEALRSQTSTLTAQTEALRALVHRLDADGAG